MLLLLAPPCQKNPLASPIPWNWSLGGEGGISRESGREEGVALRPGVGCRMNQPPLHLGGRGQVGLGKAPATPHSQMWSSCPFATLEGCVCLSLSDQAGAVAVCLCLMGGPAGRGVNTHLLAPRGRACTRDGASGDPTPTYPLSPPNMCLPVSSSLSLPHRVSTFLLLLPPSYSAAGQVAVLAWGWEQEYPSGLMDYGSRQQGGQLPGQCGTGAGAAA